LEHLIRDAWRRERLAQHARARALQYTPARLAHAYATLYTQLKRAGTPTQVAKA